MDINIKELIKNYQRNDFAPLINKAIKEVFDAGGGKVIIPSGIYECSTIYILDNVVLYLEEGAVIKLFSNLKSFANHNLKRDDNIYRPTWENCDYDGLPSKYFIYAKDSINIGIDGKGVINGNEELFYGKVTPWHIEGAFYPRIPLIFFENCKNVNISNVTLTKSAFWTVHLVGCNHVLIDSINIFNNLILTNCDGIDPDRSKNVEIKNCNIRCADDCVVLKATSATLKYGACENINVHDCNFTSTSAAIKIGTETCGDFNNILFENINITNSNRGISIMLRDKGNIKDCIFRNINMDLHLMSKIHWWGSDEGIAVTAVPRSKEVGLVSNILFENININSENGICFFGFNNNIRNVKVKNLVLKIKEKTLYPHYYLDLRPSSFGIINEEFYALTINDVNQIELDNVLIVNESRYIKKITNISKASNINMKDVRNM